jgi:hypothetical protein
MERAERAAEIIGRLRPQAAVCVFGSLARGSSSEPLGDVDLLMVEPEARSRPTALLEHIQPRREGEPPLNLLSYSTDDLREIWESGAPIAFHLAREAQVLRDPLSLLEPMLRQEPAHNYSAAARRELSRLTPYRTSSRFNGNLMACFAQVYSVGRTLVMLQLGRRGIWEFDRHACFARLAELAPEHRQSVQLIASLEPFEAWRRRRGDARLPFSPYTDDNAEAEILLAKAIAAAEQLAGELIA